MVKWFLMKNYYLIKELHRIKEEVNKNNGIYFTDFKIIIEIDKNHIKLDKKYADVIRRKVYKAKMF